MAISIISYQNQISTLPVVNITSWSVSVVGSTATATITTDAPHQMTVGCEHIIAATVPTAYRQNGSAPTSRVTAVQSPTQYSYQIPLFGARTLTGCSLNSSTTLVKTGGFLADDVGRNVTGVGVPAATTIATFVNADTVILSAATTITGTSSVTIGGYGAVTTPGTAQRAGFKRAYYNPGAAYLPRVGDLAVLTATWFVPSTATRLTTVEPTSGGWSEIATGSILTSPTSSNTMFMRSWWKLLTADDIANNVAGVGFAGAYFGAGIGTSLRVAPLLYRGALNIVAGSVGVETTPGVSPSTFYPALPAASGYSMAVIQQRGNYGGGGGDGNMLEANGWTGFGGDNGFHPCVYKGPQSTSFAPAPGLFGGLPLIVIRFALNNEPTELTHTGVMASTCTDFTGTIDALTFSNAVRLSIPAATQLLSGTLSDYTLAFIANTTGHAMPSGGPLSGSGNYASIGTMLTGSSVQYRITRVDGGKIAGSAVLRVTDVFSGQFWDVTMECARGGMYVGPLRIG